MYQHVETFTVATFRGWIQNQLSGCWLMVLDHPRFGECRWSPNLARPWDPEKHPRDPHTWAEVRRTA